jgi:protein-tyrosine-phosphatase
MIKRAERTNSSLGEHDKNAQGNVRNRILFLCTGNYYRSRYAEEFFNHLARRSGLNWVADSRALAIEQGISTVGPMAKQSLEALATDGVRAVAASRFPLQCIVEDLSKADIVIAVKEAEHRDLLTNRFSGWEDRVRYWHVHDLDRAESLEALGMLRSLVQALVRDLSDSPSI